MEKRLWYLPNPTHKDGWTDEGPPRWYPKKTACPHDLTLAERDQLVAASIAVSGDPLDPDRYAVRRTSRGLEWFKTCLTLNHADGRVEIHGYPFNPDSRPVPPRILRSLLASGTISRAEYNRLV